MFDMDFKCKGITWVGNIYDKFEAMCHEVEDIMTNQETAKYVENQVQNVGGNIKKFCAEVMNDMLPPSSEDPVKKERTDMSVDKNAELGTCKKPKDNPEKENVPHKIMEVIAPAVKDSSLVSFLGGVPQITQLLPLAAVDPDFSHEQNDTDMPKKSKVAIERETIEENPPPHYVLEVIDSIRGDSTQPSLLPGVEEEDHLLPPSSAYPVEVLGSEFAEEQNDYVGKCKKSIVDIGGDSVNENPLPSDASKLIDSSGDVSSWESIFSISSNENQEKSCASLKKITSPRLGGTIDSNILGRSDRVAEDPNAHFGSSVVLCEKEATEIGPMTPSSSILSVNSNDTLTTYKEACLMESITDQRKQCYIDAELEAFTTGRSDDDGSELENATDAFGTGMQNFEQFDNVKLEDSCIVVQPFTVSCRQRMHRSYKTKIRDAFASRMRSSKKKEYEQLAIWHADIDGETTQQRIESCTPSTVAKKLDSKNLSADDICEWEIL